MEFEQIIRFFKTMKNGDEDCDAKIIGQLLVKQAGMISIPKDILKSLDPSVPPPTAAVAAIGGSGSARGSDKVTSPWAMPIFPVILEETRSDSPTLFERVSAAFSWGPTGGVNYNSGDD